MAGMLDKWSRNAQAKAERRNAKAKLKPRPGELRVEGCEHIIGEPVLWAIAASRRRRPPGGTGMVDLAPSSLYLAIALVAGTAYALTWALRRASGKTPPPRRPPQSLGLAGTHGATV